MKILFCIDSMQKGGAERVISNLSNYFVKKNIEVDILTLLDRPCAYNLNIEINLRSLKIQEGKKNLFNKIKSIFINYKHFHEMLKKNKYDVVISFLPRASIYSILAMIGIKGKLIVSERNNPNSIYNSRIKKIFYKFMYSFADGFVFQTKGARDFFYSSVQKKSMVIANPVNNLFYSCNSWKKTNDTIINIGRLTQQKNQKLLIDAFNKFSKEYPKYKLLIYGDGPLKEELNSYINNLGLKNKVSLMGISDNIEEILNKCSMFILSSDYEGMPNALMEALTLGVPCISTDCPPGGSKELIDNNVNGLLVPICDSEALYEGMKILLDENNCLKYSDNAKNRMKEFREEIIYKKWLDYILSLYDGKL